MFFFTLAIFVVVLALALALAAPELEQKAHSQNLESCDVAEDVATVRHVLLQRGRQYSWVQSKWQPPVLTLPLQSAPQVEAPFPAAPLDGMHEWVEPEIAGDVDGLEPDPAASRSATADKGWSSDPPGRAGAVLVQRPMLRTFPGPPRVDEADWSAAAPGLPVDSQEEGMRPASGQGDGGTVDGEPFFQGEVNSMHLLDAQNVPLAAVQTSRALAPSDGEYEVSKQQRYRERVKELQQSVSTVAGRVAKAAPLQPRAFRPPLQLPLAQELADASHDPAFLEGDAAIDDVDEVSVRPHTGGAPEMVSFGIYGKNFYGLDMINEAFTIDSVLTLQWSDDRAKKLLPSGQNSLTLSDKDSKAKLWLPDVAITNHNIKGYELISTSVTVNSSGTVTKVERSISIIKNRYTVAAFPWDTQVLVLKVASATYMLDDVKLVPSKDRDLSGVTKDFLDGEGFTLVSAVTSEFEEIDGALKKSRGVMAITIHRDIDKYFQSHFVPAILLLFISYAVFWLPFITPFITPRMALSILSLLSFTTLTLKTDQMLPPGAPLTWNDVFNQNCQTLMFFTICLNVFAEVTLHQLKRGDLARQMNHECKVLWFGMLGSTLIVIILCSDWTMLSTASMITKVMLGVLMGVYVTWCGVRIHNTAPDPAH